MRTSDDGPGVVVVRLYRDHPRDGLVRIGGFSCDEQEAATIARREASLYLDLYEEEG